MSMAVVIQVDLRVCVLAVLVLVWVHRDIRSFQRDTSVALREVHEDLQTLNSKVDVIIDMLKTGITVREKQRGAIEKWGVIACRGISLVYPIGTFCDLVYYISDALKI